MKVVTISLDPKVLDSKSVVSDRNRLYGELVEHYSVVVHDSHDTTLSLTDRVTIYGVGGRHKVVRLWRVAKKLRHLIKSGECDVISCSDPYYFAAVTYFLAKYYHVGFESHILGIEKLNPVRKAIAKFFIKRASTVRVNSTRLRDRLANEFNVPWPDIAFVPIYVPTASLGFNKAPAGSQDRATQDQLAADFKERFGDNFNFVFFGRLVAVKNVPMQLRAMAWLKDALPQARLHIVGDGEDKLELKELADNLGVSDRVTWHGRQEGLALGNFFRQGDAMLLTSNAEGWPMVIFEAMTAGLPIIMTDVGCAGEMIVTEKNGLVVPVDDHEALAEAMIRMANESGLKERLVTKATEALQSYWSKEQILAGYRQSWEKAFKNKL